VGQVVWFVLQLIARKATNLAISQLKIAVLAFSLCTAVAYIFFWKKPQDIKVAIVLHSDKLATKEQLEELHRASNRVFLKGRTLRPLEDPIGYPAVYPDICFTPWYGRRYFSRDIAIVASGSLFGLPHCLAWDYHFPTAVEKLLWRSASVFCTAGPPVFYGIFMLRGYLEYAFPNLRETPTTLYMVPKFGAVRTVRGQAMILIDIIFGNICWLAYVLGTISDYLFFSLPDAKQKLASIDTLSSLIFPNINILYFTSSD
jgi:hypothetical protein